MPDSANRRTPESAFTLIELIVVIAILGILSATVLPRFVNLRREAILSTMDGIYGALNSAAMLTHAKASIAGVTSQATATLVINDETVDLVYGYPAGTVTGIVRMMNTPADDWNQRASSFAGAWIYWHGVIKKDAYDAGCFLRYRQSTGTSQPPVIDIERTGC